MWVQTSGVLARRGPTLYLEVDPEVAAYYRSLIPRAHYAQSPMYPPHVTVIRKFEEPSYLLDKELGEVVDFEYSNVMLSDHTYYWLDVHSQRIKKLRLLAGLPEHYCRRCYHMTIANKKGAAKGQQ